MSELQLNTNRMKRAETFRTLFAVNAQPGTTRKDLLKPDYWAHVAAGVSPLDRFEVRADDGSFFAEYLVISCDRTWVKVKELTFIELNDLGKEDEDKTELIYKFRGPQYKHSVVRVSDNMVMAEKLPTKDDALLWIAQHNKSKAA